MPTRELPHYWMPEQVRQILATMPAGQPWLFALLLWRSALRQAEALDLEWRDLSFAAASPTTTVLEGKGGRSRLMPEHPELVGAFRAEKQGESVKPADHRIVLCAGFGPAQGFPSFVWERQWLTLTEVEHQDYVTAIFVDQIRYQYGSVALVKSPLASANREKGKALRRLCSDPKQASNRLLGRSDSGIDDVRLVAPCDRKSHRNRRVVDQLVLKLRR